MQRGGARLYPTGVLFRREERGIAGRRFVRSLSPSAELNEDSEGWWQSWHDLFSPKPKAGHRDFTTIYYPPSWKAARKNTHHVHVNELIAFTWNIYESSALSFNAALDFLCSLNVYNFKLAPNYPRALCDLVRLRHCWEKNPHPLVLANFSSHCLASTAARYR